MTPKVKQMLLSNDPELKTLAMSLIQADEPAVWCALLNYTGNNANEQAIITQIENQGHIVNIGHSVRYRGIPDAPPMTITDVTIRQVTSAGTTHKVYVYYTEIQAKYWNKSTQAFVKVTDRLECFEILNNKINYDESATTDIAIAAERHSPARR